MPRADRRTPGAVTQVGADKDVMRCALLLTILSLTACGSEKAEPQVEVPETPAPSSMLALPVTAPMRVRERLLNDLDGHNDAARQRRRDMDSVMRQNR